MVRLSSRSNEIQDEEEDACMPRYGRAVPRTLCVRWPCDMGSMTRQSTPGRDDGNAQGCRSTTSANGLKVSTQRSKHGSADELDVLSRSCFPAAGPTTHAENPQGEHGRTLGSPLRSRVNNSKKKQLDAIWAMHACIALCTGLLALVRPALFEVFMSFGGVRYVQWMFTRVHMSEWRVIAHAHGICMHTYRSS